MNLVEAPSASLASPESRGMGVMVLLNDEIHAWRAVATKTLDTRWLQTFPHTGLRRARPCRWRCGGVLSPPSPPSRAGHRVRHQRTSMHLPRAGDISYSPRGGRRDGDSGPSCWPLARQGHRVRRGFAPGSLRQPGEAGGAEAGGGCRGIVVVQSTRAGSGRTFQSSRLKANGLLIADKLFNPQKARILLALALTETRDPAADCVRIFRTYWTMSFDPDAVRAFERAGWIRAVAGYEKSGSPRRRRQFIELAVGGLPWSLFRPLLCP